MPAVYAHYRFGAKVSRKLEGDLKEIVTKYHPQFAIGLQGPDAGSSMALRWCGKKGETAGNTHICWDSSATLSWTASAILMSMK